MDGRVGPRRAAHIFVLAAAACLCACDGPPPDYLPLGGEHVWKYRVQRTIKGEQKQQKFLLASLPAAKAGGTTYFPVRRLDDRIEYYERSADGVFLAHPGRESRIRVLPGKLESGVRWQEQSRILFLEITGAFSGTFQERVRTTIPLDYVVESTDDTVAVPAGRFGGCLRIKGTGSLFAGNTLKTFLGIRFIKVEQTEWYAPGVGLVRRVRNEYTTPAEWSNRYEEELESFR